MEQPKKKAHTRNSGGEGASSRPLSLQPWDHSWLPRPQRWQGGGCHSTDAKEGTGVEKGSRHGSRVAGAGPSVSTSKAGGQAQQIS